MTFALLCDLTTYMHVADLLRIDRRRDPVELRLIELKTGKVNLLLERELDKYIPEHRSIEKIDSNPVIDENRKHQAKRMMRQRIRLHNVHTIMRTDRGLDTKFGDAIHPVGPNLDCPKYDAFLEDMVTDAAKAGASAGSVGHCIHFGVGKSEQPVEAFKKAERALNRAVDCAFRDQTPGLAMVRNELTALAPPEELFTLYDLFASNLYGGGYSPFTSWGVSEETLVQLIRKRLRILGTFDLAGFMYLARSLGMDLQLSTIKEAGRFLSRAGADELVICNHRLLVHNANGVKSYIGRGLISRLVHDFFNPIPILRQQATSPWSFTFLQANHEKA